MRAEGGIASLSELGAAEAARRIAQGELRSEALVEACLARIAAREPVIGAWQHLEPERALADARACDRAKDRRGPLHGVPVGIKDLFDTADMPSGYGSPIYEGHRPAADAACVTRVRAAGAVIVGKTVTTEFACFTPGKTANPHNPAHTPGGSSSGSAAAVADFMVPLAVGSQTAGSVIRPAAFCGVVGVKASHGRIDAAGAKPLAAALDTVGVFARSVEDAGLFWTVLADAKTAIAAAPPPAALRIAVCHTDYWSEAEAPARAAIDEAAKHLAGAGAEIAEIELPVPCHGLNAVQQTIMVYEASRSFAADYRDNGARLSPGLRSLIEMGQTTSEAAYKAAINRAAAARRSLAALFDEHDLLLTPPAKGEAPRGLGATGDPVFNRLWTLLHVPCVTLPTSLGPQGLPVGIQLVGAYGSDAELLARAGAIAAALPPPSVVHRRAGE